MLDKMNELYQQMIQNYEGGLSNTSTKKFDGIVSSIAGMLGIPENEVYATGSGSRPGNLEVRLSQGVRATTHTTVGLGFIVDEKNTPENVAKLTNSALVTCKKFLGRGKAHYDNIVILVESNGMIEASGIICQKRTAITEKLIQELKVSNIQEISSVNNTTLFSSISQSNLQYLSALRTKPFMLLAGISGTGKSRIVRKLAQATTTQLYVNEEDRWKDNRPENFELIQVKPNWHNSMDVVGFYSNISKKYEFTTFVEFVVKAWQHIDTPYFLCLDEMNLAPVEEYFAEFLSAIESRSTDKDDNYVTDPIIKPFKKFGKEACEDMLKHLLGEAHHTESNPLAVQFAEQGLTLPPNLMVIGTVNMDETTFSFSRKVLDRAMSIEMNEVDYDKFLSGESEQFPLLTDKNELLVKRPQHASEVREKIDGPSIINYLKDVNNLFEGTPFQLGYRAANEAMLYVAASRDFAGDEFSIENALDEFTLMKILSRIEGDDSRLAIDDNDPRIASIDIDSITDDGEDGINLLNCLRAIVRKHIGQDSATEKKINVMYRTLKHEHFVSYWA